MGWSSGLFRSFREKSHHIVIIKHDKTYFLANTHSHAHTQNAYIRSEKRSSGFNTYLCKANANTYHMFPFEINTR